MLVSCYIQKINPFPYCRLMSVLVSEVERSSASHGNWCIRSSMMLSKSQPSWCAVCFGRKVDAPTTLVIAVAVGDSCATPCCALCLPAFRRNLNVRQYVGKGRAQGDCLLLHEQTLLYLIFVQVPSTKTYRRYLPPAHSVDMKTLGVTTVVQDLCGVDVVNVDVDVMKAHVQREPN